MTKTTENHLELRRHAVAGRFCLRFGSFLPPRRTAAVGRSASRDGVNPSILVVVRAVEIEPALLVGRHLSAAHRTPSAAGYGKRDSLLSLVLFS